MKAQPPLANALRTLVYDSSELKVLAAQSGIDVFSFYQGADLSGLNLAGQDLTGLNFDRANLQNSCLDGIRFDKGAFNGSYVGENYFSIMDEYDFFIDDVFSAQRYGLYHFVRFRGSSLEKGISKTKLSYSAFSEQSTISTQTLRKARAGGVVAAETASGICGALLDGWERSGFDDLFSHESELRQPFLEFIDLKQNGGFEHISRHEYLDVYRSKIFEELEGGPLEVPLFRSSFAVDAWFVRNRHIVLMPLRR